MNHSKTKQPGTLSRRQLLQAAAVALPAALAAACAPTAPAPAAAPTKAAAPAQGSAPTAAPAAKGAPVEILFHSRSGQQPYYENEAKIFNEKQDKVRVKLELTPNADYHTKLTTLAAGGSLGDCYYNIIFGTTYPFAANGIHLPVDSLLQRDKIDKAQFWTAPIELITWEGKLQGLPLGTHPGWTCMFTNVTEWEAAGAPLPKWEWTYEKEWLAAVQQVNTALNKDPAKKRFGYQFDYSPQNSLLFIRSWGGDWIDAADRKTAKVSSEKTVAALQFMRELVNKKLAPTQAETVASMFDNGLTGSYSTGNWTFGTYRKTIADKFKWRSYGMPAGPGGRGTFVGVDTFAINSKTKNVDAAWEFGKYMVFDEGAALRCVPGELPPTAIKKLWQDKFFTADPNWEDQIKWMEAKGWTVPANARVAEFNTVFSAGIQAVLNPANDFKAEIDKMQKALQDLLSKPPA